MSRADREKHREELQQAFANANREKPVNAPSMIDSLLRDQKLLRESEYQDNQRYWLKEALQSERKDVPWGQISTFVNGIPTDQLEGWCNEYGVKVISYPPSKHPFGL